MGGPGEKLGVVLLAAERNGREIRGIGFEQNAVFGVTKGERADVVRLLERHHAAASEVSAERFEPFEIGDASGKRVENELSACVCKIGKERVSIVVCQRAAVDVARMHDRGPVQTKCEFQKRAENLKLFFACAAFVVVVQADLADRGEPPGSRGERFELLRFARMLHHVQRVKSGGEKHAVEMRCELRGAAAGLEIRAAQQNPRHPGLFRAPVVLRFVGASVVAKVGMGVKEFEILRHPLRLHLFLLRFFASLRSSFSSSSRNSSNSSNSSS